MSKRNIGIEEELIKFLNQLEAPYKEPAELFYVENMSQKAIAEKLNLSIAITRHRLSKAKFLLKKLSGSEDYKQAYQLMYGRDHNNIIDLMNELPKPKSKVPKGDVSKLYYEGRKKKYGF